MAEETLGQKLKRNVENRKREKKEIAARQLKVLIDLIETDINAGRSNISYNANPTTLQRRSFSYLVEDVDDIDMLFRCAEENDLVIKCQEAVIKVTAKYEL